jgi:hypothetical protein
MDSDNRVSLPTEFVRRKARGAAIIISGIAFQNKLHDCRSAVRFGCDRHYLRPRIFIVAHRREAISCSEGPI